MSDRHDAGTRLFRVSAGGALLVHAALLFAANGIQGGADLGPHLRLAQQMADAPALRTVYAPAYHALGALLIPWLGMAATVKGLAFAAAAALIAGFRSFQRAASLPDASAAAFAWSPYTFALTWCAPKVEAAGYALAFAALGLLIRRRHAALAAALAATFLVHTASALFLGLAGGLLALARRDGRALLALGAGAAAAAPLLLVHVAAGCTPAQSLLFSQGDYLRTGVTAASGAAWDRIAILAGPVAVVAALVGAPALWRRDRPLAVVCAALLVLYLNELWLAPFGAGTTLNLMRGLTVLAFATAIPAGVALVRRPRLAPPVIAACAAWAIGAVVFTVPASCYVRTYSADEVSGYSVDRCTFRWWRSGPARSG